MARETFMFDAYGTLFDVHAAVARAGISLGERAAAVSQLWRTKQLEYSWTTTLMGGFEDFWTLTERSLDYALASHGLADPHLRAALMDAYLTLDAFPDVVPVLTALKARGCTTAIFTNGTRRMVDAAIEGAGLGDLIDRVVTVEAVRAYKPKPDVYAAAQAAIGAKHPGEVGFVSSNRWDVAGAAAFGFAAIWVNRSGLPDEYPGAAPRAVLRSLEGLQAFCVT
jgi:2-haloacid dehalogenase